MIPEGNGPGNLGNALTMLEPKTYIVSKRVFILSQTWGSLMKRSLQKKVMIACLMAMFFSSCEWPDRQLQDVDPLKSPIPSAVRFVYDELANQLREIELYIATDWSGERYPTAFGTELLVADSHRGEILLTEPTFSATVLSLDRLKGLGVKVVALNIQVPILLPSFPRSSDYLAYYRRVVSEIKKRNFVSVIEIGTTFKDPLFNQLRVDIRGLTLDRFKKDLLDMARVICAEIRPDYLTILNEPGTQSKATGLDLGFERYTEVIQFVLNGLDHRETRVGAGAGTWERFEYFESLAKQTMLDYVDLHIYPVQRDFVLDKCMRIAALARTHKKKLVIGEAWLSKVAEMELDHISPAAAFGRDVFSLWEPRDMQFVTVIFKLSHYLKAEYCSFFWMRHFYGYVDFNEETRSLSPPELFKLADEVAAKNIASNTLTGTGLKLQQLLALQ